MVVYYVESVFEDQRIRYCLEIGDYRITQRITEAVPQKS